MVAIALLVGYPLLGIRVYRHRRRFGNRPYDAMLYAASCVLRQVRSRDGGDPLPALAEAVRRGRGGEREGGVSRQSVSARQPQLHSPRDSGVDRKGSPRREILDSPSRRHFGRCRRSRGTRPDAGAARCRYPPPARRLLRHGIAATDTLVAGGGTGVSHGTPFRSRAPSPSGVSRRGVPSRSPPPTRRHSSCARSFRHQSDRRRLARSHAR